MDKVKIQYRCSQCGDVYPKWQGKCDNCEAWNTLEEKEVLTSSQDKAKRTKSLFAINKSTEPIQLSQIKSSGLERLKLGVTELDNVLGGGLFPGSLLLIGGDPGIGKSTLMLQVLNRLEGKSLYISGEESPQQIKARAKRLKIESEKIFLQCENELETIIEEIKKFQPDFLVIDSIQSIYSNQLTSAPGNTSQIKECGNAFMTIAKMMGLTTFLIGHVTKDGGIAGPRLLEHMVDTVLFFEDAGQQEFRLLRAYKNRFGSINEVALFRMTDKGLAEIKTGEWLFGKHEENLMGTAISSIIEGTRAFCVEMQALVTPSHFGYPQRTASGLENRRMALLIAIYEKYLDSSLGNADLFFKITGGFQTKDPALDFAVLAAVFSSFSNQEIRSDVAFLGEVGLSGEIRPVSYFEKRLKELSKNGVKSVLGNFNGKKNIANIELFNYSKISKAFAQTNQFCYIRSK